MRFMKALDFTSEPAILVNKRVKSGKDLLTKLY